MRWSVIGGAALAVGLSSAALADGMPARAVAYEAPFSWTGVYIGLNGGYSWGRGDEGNTAMSHHVSVFRAFGLPAQTLISDNTVAGTASGASNVDGWIGGGQVGLNMQARSFVFGIEADLQFSRERGGNTYCSPLPCGATSVSLTANHDQDWFGTLRARAGVLVEPRFLLYVTGGIAYSHFNSDYTVGSGAGPSITLSDEKKKGGWVIGAGAEWAIHRNLSLKAEYLYIDYGDVGGISGTSQAILPNTPTPGFTTVVDGTLTGSTHLTDQVFRIGLNYRFGGPVRAAY